MVSILDPRPSVPAAPREVPLFMFDTSLSLLAIPDPASPIDRRMFVKLSTVRQAGWLADDIAMARLPRCDARRLTGRR